MTFDKRSGVRELVKSNEGLRLVAYDDSRPNHELRPGEKCVGTLTIGFGCTAGVTPGMRITIEEAEIMLDDDILAAVTDARSVIGAPWAKIDEVRRAALIDLAFEVGRVGMASFLRLITAVRKSDWKRASAEMLRSKVAQQAPARTAKRAAMLLDGAWPSTVADV